MKRNWFTGLAVVMVLGLVLVFAGCQKKATFVGTWSGVVTDQGDQGIITCEFAKDGTFNVNAFEVATGRTETESGTYSVDKDDANTAHVTFGYGGTFDAYLVDKQIVMNIVEGQSWVLDRAGDSSNASFNNVDEFLKQYEKVIVSVEKAAKSKKAQDVLKFSSEATMLYSRAQTIIADNSKWNTAQLAKLTALVQRAAVAAQNMY